MVLVFKNPANITKNRELWKLKAISTAMFLRKEIWHSIGLKFRPQLHQIEVQLTETFGTHQVLIPVKQNSIVLNGNVGNLYGSIIAVAPDSDGSINFCFLMTLFLLNCKSE